MLPSELTDLSSYPRVQEFVRIHLDMQANDVRSMLRLPLPELGMTGGCNFAAAAVLCILVAGLAKVLYSRSKGQPGTGNGFVAILLEFFPWQRRENRQKKAEALYKIVRNPLVHSLAVFTKSAQRASRLGIEKGPLSEPQLQSLESAQRRPPWLPLPVTKRGSRYKVNVPALYWGVIRLFQRLANDHDQMAKAETRLCQSLAPPIKE